MTTEPTADEMAEYLNGEHGPPHPEVVRIIQADLERAIRKCDHEWAMARDGSEYCTRCMRDDQPSTESEPS